MISDRPLWIPKPGDTPSRSPQQFVELFARYRGGDDTAFDEILWATKPLVDGFLRSPMAHRDSEEFTSRLWQGVIKAARRWNGRAHGKGNLGWIAYCRRGLAFCQQHHRKQRKIDLKTMLSVDLFQQADDGEGFMAEMGLASRMPNSLITEPAPYTLDVSILLAKYLPKLTARERRVINSVALDGQPLQILADRLGVTRQAISLCLIKALDRLRAAMSADGVKLEDYMDHGTRRSKKGTYRWHKRIK